MKVVSLKRFGTEAASLYGAIGIDVFVKVRFVFRILFQAYIGYCRWGCTLASTGGFAI